MTAFDYSRTRATAARLIKKFGQSVQVRRTIKIGPDWDPTFTEENYSALAAVLDYTDREINGTLILAGDKKVFVSTEGLSITPELSDKLSIGGLVHSIMQVKPLSPAGLVVFWELQCRR